MTNSSGSNVGFWFEEKLADLYNWKLNPDRNCAGTLAGDLQTSQGLEVQAKFGKASIVPVRPLENASKEEQIQILEESLQALCFQILAVGFLYRNKLFVAQLTKDQAIEVFRKHTDLWKVEYSSKNHKLKFRLNLSRVNADLVLRRESSKFEIVSL